MERSSPSKSTRHRGFAGPILLALAVIALAAVAVYSNSFAGALVFDDVPWITRNFSIRHLWPIGEVLFPPHAELIGGRPLVSLTLAVNYALGGLNVWGYHAVNLAIHILAAWTLFGITRRTLTLPQLDERFAPVATPLALVVALLWTIHPLHTESVTYVIQRTESLVGLFYLLTLYCVIRAATSTIASSAKSLSSGQPSACGFAGIANTQELPATVAITKLWYVAATMACLFGMATKEVMATAPLLVLLYDRTFLAGSFREALRRRWALYLTLVATWGVVLALLISTGFHNTTTGFAVQSFTCWSYLLTQPGVIAHYLRLAFWPTGLCLDYGWPAAQTIGDVLFPGILVASLLALTVWAMVKRPAWGFFGACFFVILAPSSSLIPIQDAAFEHRMYLSLAALVAGLVAGGFIAGQSLVRRGKLSRSAAQFMGGALVLFTGVALGIVAFHRNADYQSDLSIWEDTIAKAPANERAYNALGNAFADRKQSGEAIVSYEKAIALNPDYAEAHHNRGYALAGRGRLDEAIVEYDKALAIKPDYADVHINLGTALAGSGRLEEAMLHFQKAMELAPDVAEPHYNLGYALAHFGRADEAIAQYRLALAIKPDYADVSNNLGLALAARGRTDEAIACYQEALELNPNVPNLHNNMGTVLTNCGKVDEAIVHFRKALEIKPDYAAARKNLDAALGQKERAK
jgi:protein O-mannosyl-transferase